MARCDLLVTGAGGFVGRHLVQRARAQGLAVETATCDLRASAAVAELVANARPAAVVHLAASPRRPGADPWQALADDVAMAGALLSAVAERAPEAPVLVAGSAAQYGMGLAEALRESDPLEPVAAYGAAKCVLERACTAAALNGGLRVIWARSFNHVGPGQGPDAPVAQWARQVATAELHGSGTLRTGALDVVRDFLDVRDVADAYLALVRSPAEGPVNVCSGEPTPLSRMAEIVIGQATVPVELELDPALVRGLDPPFVVGDPGRLRTLTDWAPRFELTGSVGELLDECRAALAAAASQPATPLAAG
ncbi:MAG TPA: NAD-dependent epimerase/dehydratase family protein [Solirubrobacteraceae bacterium]|jgi:GDP-4-dehydro-6-deoxy-D-mannose reductase